MLAGEVVRIVEHVGGGVDAAGGHGVLAQQGEQRRRRRASPSTPPTSASSSRSFAPRAVWVGEPVVVGQLGSAHRQAQPGEHRVGVAGDQHLGAVARRIGVGRRDAGQRAARPVPHHAGDVVVGHRRLHQRGDRLVDGDVDLLAAPARGTLVQRGERADHGEHGGQRVAEADAAAGRRTVRVAGRVADPADRLADRTEPGLRRPGPVWPKPETCVTMMPRVDRTQRVVVEAPLGQPAGPEVLDHDVALWRRAPARQPVRPGRGGRARPIACCGRSSATTGPTRRR